MATIVFSTDGPQSSFFQQSPFLTRRPHLKLPRELAHELCNYLQSQRVEAQCHSRDDQEAAFIDVPSSDAPDMYARLEKAIDAWLSGRGNGADKNRLTTWHMEDGDELA